MQTGAQTLFSYNWSEASLNFVKPKKKDLVIYEALVRDFDADRTFQDMIDRIDYFKNLRLLLTFLKILLKSLNEKNLKKLK